MSKRKADDQQPSTSQNNIASTDQTVKGYILNMSPVRLSKNNKPFFNLNIEVDDNTVKKAVCYVPRKRRLFEEAESRHLGVNISHCNIYENGTIKIDDRTAVKHEVLGFKPHYEMEITPLSKVINETPIDGFVNVRCKVQLEEMQKVPVTGGKADMRKGYLADKSDYIRLVLWREYASLIQDGKSYILCNLKKTQWNSEDELHSSNTTSFKIVEDLTYYKHPNVDANFITLSPCSIVGAKFTHTIKCLFCGEKISCIGKIGGIECDSCGGNSVMTSTGQQKFWTLVVNHEDVTNKLDIKADQLPDIEIDQVKVYLTSNQFKITYSIMSGTISSIELVSIDELEYEKSTTKETDNKEQS